MKASYIQASQVSYTLSGIKIIVISKAIPFSLCGSMLAQYVLWLSVCLSITSHYCTKIARRRIMETTQTLASWRQRSRRNSTGVTPNGSAKYRWGRWKSVISNQYHAISQKRCMIRTSLCELRTHMCIKIVIVRSSGLASSVFINQSHASYDYINLLVEATSGKAYKITQLGLYKLSTRLDLLVRCTILIT